MALLLSAVQAAREAARRLQCQNNLKQLSLALQNYHCQWNCFPPAMVFDPGEDPTTSKNYRPNWVINILPYLEQQPLFDSFNRSQPISAAANAVPRSQRLSVMLCPTERRYGTL